MVVAKKRVMVVEDEFAIAQYLVEELTDMGFDVCEPCSTYEEALAAVEEQEPDLVMLDVSLRGGRNGYDLAREIQKRCAAEIVFCTGAIPNDAAAGDIRSVGLLVKPFHADQIRLVLRPFLRASSGRSTGLARSA